MRLIKIKIGDKYTKISYRKKRFNNRIEAMKATIYHLERMLKEKGKMCQK